MASLFKLELPPGIFRLGTIYQAAGRYWEAPLCRWDLTGAVPALKPIKGWLQRTTTAMTGSARALISWRTANTTRFIAAGTHSKLYAVTQTAAAPTDITPVGFTPGRASAVVGGGFGVGPFGMGTFGTPRVDNISVQDASMWSLDTYGQYLVGVMAEDAIVYEWQLNTSTPAAAISGAPTAAALVVSPRQHLILLGAAGNSRRIQWSDAADNTAWTPSATNQAGDFDIQSHARLMCAKRTRGQVLVLSEVDAHFMSYIGLPFVFEVEPIGENCGAISRGCMVATESFAIWMSQAGFFIYDGTVRGIDCEVWDAVFGDMNTSQRSKITAELNSAENEAAWIFPSAGSAECDTKVVYNYQKGYWNVYPWARNAGCDRGAFMNPLAVTSDGYIYDHETGYDYEDSTPSFETGPLELGAGDRRIRVRRLIADEGTAGDVQTSYHARDWPNDSEVVYGPYVTDNPTPLRFSGRAIRASGEFVTASADSKWAPPRFEVIAGGKR